MFLCENCARGISRGRGTATWGNSVGSLYRAKGISLVGGEEEKSVVWIEKTTTAGSNTRKNQLRREASKGTGPEADHTDLSELREKLSRGILDET